MGVLLLLFSPPPCVRVVVAVIDPPDPCKPSPSVYTPPALFGTVGTAAMKLWAPDHDKWLASDDAATVENANKIYGSDLASRIHLHRCVVGAPRFGFFPLLFFVCSFVGRC